MEKKNQKLIQKGVEVIILRSENLNPPIILLVKKIEINKGREAKIV